MLIILAYLSTVFDVGLLLSGVASQCGISTFTKDLNTSSTVAELEELTGTKTSHILVTRSECDNKIPQISLNLQTSLNSSF